MTFEQFLENRMPGCDEAQRLIAKKAWGMAQEAMRNAIEIRAQIERRSGRIEVADALEAACSQTAVECNSISNN